MFTAKMNTSDAMADELLERRDVSFWLKKAIKENLVRDPVDAVNDAEILLDVLKKRCSEALGC
ncbi:MAG: hypothetical protein IPJ48_16835 [Propionivibrio sp.]|uniref:Uncharacterized protein n=1 Tax=Candidatus Propionivibrio dominans TaxID=2954373 RepID=A0A9D7FGY8_9RHOO|nr:hypothetical protein [Candidatus Propionivibrio dominans]